MRGNRIGVWHDMVPDAEHAFRMFTRPDPKDRIREERKMDKQAYEAVVRQPNKKVATDEDVRHFFASLGGYINVNAHDGSES